MKYAHINPHTSSRVLGFYIVRDKQDPNGFIYKTLPPANELVELTAEQWATRMDNLWYDPSTKTFGPIPGPTLSELKEDACKQIDTTAAAEWNKQYSTIDAGQALIYQKKLEQAIAYKNAGYPKLPDPLPETNPDYEQYGHVRAYRDSLRLTNPNATDKKAANRIINKARLHSKAEIRRERIRLMGKARVNAAKDEAGVIAARDKALSQLKALQP